MIFIKFELPAPLNLDKNKWNNLTFASTEPFCLTFSFAQE